MKIGVLKETGEGERRVCLVPESVSKLKGSTVVIEAGAGKEAGFPDSDYVEQGASICDDASTLRAEADLVLKILPPAPSEIADLRRHSALVSFLYPGTHLDVIRVLAEREVEAFAMELIPRIARAQAMDALSSQSMVAGYKAVLMAAGSLPKIFPLLMTAAGTIAPAKVLVLGAGVAGLEAVSTARRLGAVVEAYDIRPTVKEQVQSLGARFVELPLETKDAQTSGGYANAQSDDFYRKQQELLTDHTGQSDVVITTALVPGKRAPLLITEEAVKRMRPGSVVVDLAAEQGGNCALTVPGKTVTEHGVTIHGPLNIQSTMAFQASQLYSRNVVSFITALFKDGNLTPDPNDEIVRSTMVVSGGKVLHGPTRALLEGASQ